VAIYMVRETSIFLPIIICTDSLDSGIITKYTLRTYPIGRVWGGYRIYTTGKRDQIYAGFHDFVKNPNPDPKAAIIVNTSYATQGIITYMVYFFYDGPKPAPGAFGNLVDIPSLIDLCAERDYADLVRRYVGLIS
jgi:hypothetical protein